MLLLLSLLSVAAPASADDDTPAERSAALVWTGALSGIGSGSYHFVLHERLGTAGAPELQRIRPEHGWLVQGSFMLRAEDGRVATLVELLGGEPTCAPTEPGSALTTPSEHLLLPGPLPIWTASWAGMRRQTRQWRCVRGSASAELVAVGDGPADALPSWAPTRWETRLGLAWDLGDDGVVHTVGVPKQEGTRRITALKEQVSLGAIFVDAGSFVDGASSVDEGQLSLHRPTGFAALRELDPAALAPGYTELIAGYDGLRAEAGPLPYLAANWRSKDPARALPASTVVTAPGSDVRVGLVGAVDPSLSRRIPLLGQQGITLVDPLPAIVDAVAELRGAAEPVDVVVLVADLPADALQAIRLAAPDIDVILGDRGSDIRAARGMQIEIAEPGRWRQPAPLALPLDGVMTGELVLAEQGGLRTVYAEPVPVTPEWTPDAAALAKVTRVRLDSYPALDHPLLPGPPGALTTTMSGAMFSRVVCQAVEDETRADLVLLPALRGPSTPGAQTALLVANQLALPDRLEVHRIPGDQFAKLLDQLVGMVPTACGAPFATKTPKARGRTLDNERHYRVVTTDRFRQGNPEVGGLLDAAHGTSGIFDPPHISPIRTASGEPATLRGVALVALDRLHAEHGDALVAELIGRDSSRVLPQWLARIRQLSLRAEGFKGAGDDAYSQVPETLATSPSSFTLGSATDVSMEYSSRDVVWDVRGRSLFTRLRTDELTQETSDDLKLSTSVTLPGLTTPAVVGIAFRPYSEALYDSEFTAVEATDGSHIPLQRDLSLTLGAAAVPKGVLRTLRIGAFSLADLSRPDKQLELGGRAEVESRVTFGPRLRWSTLVDGYVFGGTPDDDASDLRFKVRLDSRVLLPLAEWLDVAVYGAGFVFQGRVPETSEVGASWSVGVSLDVRGVFEL